MFSDFFSSLPNAIVAGVAAVKVDKVCQSKLVDAFTWSVTLEADGNEGKGRMIVGLTSVSFTWMRKTQQSANYFVIIFEKIYSTLDAIFPFFLRKAWSWFLLFYFIYLTFSLSLPGLPIILNAVTRWIKCDTRIIKESIKFLKNCISSCNLYFGNGAPFCTV